MKLLKRLLALPAYMREIETLEGLLVNHFQFVVVDRHFVSHTNEMMFMLDAWLYEVEAVLAEFQEISQHNARATFITGGTTVIYVKLQTERASS